jgi:hypothetical protein
MKKFILPQLSPDACANITAGVGASCALRMINGANDRLVLINYSEVSSLTPNGTNAQIIEAIVMTTPGTTKGYVFQGKQSSVEPKQAMVKKKYGNSWDHEIRFKIFNGEPLTKIQIEKIMEGKFMAIVENNYRGTAGNGAFEIYGVTSGLWAESIERDIANPETLGCYDIVLKSGDAKEDNLPKTLFITDYATSKAVVDGIL